jgi:hypothetical protein
LSTLASVILRDVIANLPTASIPGRIFFATDTLVIKRDNGTTWDDVTPAAATINFATPEVPSGAISGTTGSDGNATFTLTHTPNPSAALPLFKNGLRMTQGTAYTLSGNTITYLAGYIPITGAPGDTHVADSYRY